MSRTLVVLPDDSAKPILDAINHATKSLRIKMFVFTDPVVDRGRGGSTSPRCHGTSDAQSQAPQWRLRER